MIAELMMLVVKLFIPEYHDWNQTEDLPEKSTQSHFDRSISSFPVLHHFENSFELIQLAPMGCLLESRPLNHAQSK
jgi:hypothetical protein